MGAEGSITVIALPVLYPLKALALSLPTAGRSFDPVIISSPWSDASIKIGSTGLPAGNSNLGVQKSISSIDLIIRYSGNSLPGNLYFIN